MRTPTDNPTDTLGNLGAPIRPAAPAPAPRPTDTPGILKQPDGRLETQIPLSPVPRAHSKGWPA